MADLVAFTVPLLSPLVPARDASAIGTNGSSGKGDGTGEGRSKNESGRGKVFINDGDAGAMSNWQQKRIKLQQQKAMQRAAAVAAAATDGGSTIKSGIACSSQKWQRSSLLEEEVAQHAVRVQLHQHSMNFSVLSGGTKLFKLNHAHYEKLCLLAAVPWGGSIGGNTSAHGRRPHFRVRFQQAGVLHAVKVSFNAWLRLPDDPG